MSKAVTHVNVVQHALGKVFGLLEEGSGYRWGLKRAQGLTSHPIYFGYLLVLTLPWALEARRLATTAHAVAMHRRIFVNELKFVRFPWYERTRILAHEITHVIEKGFVDGRPTAPRALRSYDPIRGRMTTVPAPRLG